MKLAYIIVLWIGLAVFTIFLATAFVHTSFHELVHQRAATYSGCINSTIKIDLFSGSYFKCYEYERPRTEDEIRDERIVDNMNEIIGYNNKAIWISVILSGGLVSFLLGLIYTELRGDL